MLITYMDLYTEYERGQRLLDEGNPAGAAQALAPVLAAEPGNAGVRLALARAYFHTAQLGRAEEHLRWLVDRDPTDHYAHHVLGRTLQRRGRFEQALSHLRIAAALHPRADYADAVEKALPWVTGTSEAR